MGARLNNLFDRSSFKNTTYQELDCLVAEFQAAETTREEEEILSNIMCSFHGYLMKYVRLIKGQISHTQLDNLDTVRFLALFLPGESKLFNNYKRIYRFIVEVSKHLEEGDIYNELAVIFIQLLHSYKVYEEVSFAKYITLYMRWAIKDWIMETSRKNRPLTTSYGSSDPALTIFSSEETSIEDFCIDLPQMNMAWVVKPDTKIFEVLSPYERFLLMQNFKEGLGVRQIGERLGRTKDTINKHIRLALNKLRDAYEKECNKYGFRN